MKTGVSKQTKGFTIIEVLIVLSIAGLILLIVFLAIPSLQRNSRNTRRRSDVAQLLGSLGETVNNSNGKLPASCNGALSTCFVADPTLSLYDNKGSNVSFQNNSAATSPAAPSNPEQVAIHSYTKCNPATPGTTTNSGASSRSVVALFRVETASSTTAICVDS